MKVGSHDACTSSRGLGQGRTLELGGRNLYSRRYGLAGRPDRIIDGGIPEEWERSLRVYDRHRAQIGCYFILIEEETGVRPPHGFISPTSGERVKLGEPGADLTRISVGVDRRDLLLTHLHRVALQPRAHYALRFRLGEQRPLF